MSGTESVLDAVDPATVDAGAAADTVEAQARRMGWVPRDEFKGDAATWRPAEEFLDRGMNLLPVLQQQFRALDGRYAKVERELESSRRANADLIERFRTADERAYKRALHDLEARRSSAVANGDTAAFEAADKEMRELRETAPAPTTQSTAAAAPAPPAEVIAWVAANPWFSSNEEARDDAVAIQSVVDKQNPGMPLSERLALTRKKVMALHPGLFENPRRSAPAAVSASSPEPSRAVNPRSFEALPADVRREFERAARNLEGRGKPLTKEEFARYYWENEP